jgi:glycoside/pentoside/hexuronide:cation symporter, GPH family
MQPPPQPLAASILAAYGGPAFALAGLLFFVQFYFFKYATDVLLLPPAAVSLLFGAAKVWDGVSGPLIGSFSDRTRTRWGRRRPFLIGALPLLAIGFAMLWVTPHGLSAGWQLAWMGTALFVFFTAFDLYMLPHMALGAELSPDSHQRTRLFAVRQMTFTMGLLLAFTGIQIAMNAADPRATTVKLALPAVLAAVLVLAVTPLVLREPDHPGRTGGRGLVASFRDVLATSASRRLLVVQFIEAVGVGAVGTMAPFIAQYLLQRPDVVGFLPAAYVLAGVVSIPIWVLVSRRLGQRETWMAAMLLASVSFGGIWFVRPGDLVLMMGLLVVAGAAMGCGQVLANAILAEVIDLDARRTGERKEGAYSAAMMLAVKVGAALAVAASGPMMAVTGFVPNAEQTESSLVGLRILFAGMPCVGFALGAWIFRGFSLDGGSAPPPVLAAPAEAGAPLD